MKKLLNLLRNVANCEAGTATLEAIIVLPVAISLMAGGIEFGRIFSERATVDKSMRSAARYLAKVPGDAVCDWGLNNAKNIAVYGQITAGSTPLVPGMTTDMVTKFSPASCVALPDPTIIELRAAVPFAVNMLPTVGPFSNIFTLSVSHQERHIGE